MDWDKSLLVMVFVPTLGAAARDRDAPRGVIGTGYPVGPDLILTARHLLDLEPRDPSRPISVRWHYHRTHPDADPNGWIAIPEAAVICPEAADLDAMLLRCPRPDAARGWGIVSEVPPANEMQWTSEGFPDAGDYEGLRHPCSFRGDCFSKAAEENYFELAADAPPQADDDWRGASGMPIFVGRRILGVARQIPRRFGAARLHATPCWKLLRDQGFRQALGFEERKARVTKLRCALIKALDRYPSSLAALAKALGQRDELPAPTDLSQRADRLAERLLDTEIAAAIAALRTAHRALKKEAGAAAAEPLVTAACQVVPVLFDHGVPLPTTGVLESPVLVPLAAATLTVAELIMAGVEGREALFRPRAHEDDQPAGRLSLPLHPEQGIGAAPALALAEHLGRKLDPGAQAIQGLRTAIDGYLGTFVRTDPGAPRRAPQETIQLAADLLKARRRDEEPAYYMVFFLPEEADERERIEGLAADLKRDYQAIAFLGLDPAFSRERADRNLVDPLCRMLPLKT